VPEATLTSKGQITLPLEVRETLGLKAGSRVSFVRTPDGSYELIPATGSVRALRGLLSAERAPVSLEQMEQAIADGAAERSGR
jgi:antitoxin PrlF